MKKTLLSVLLLSSMTGGAIPLLKQKMQQQPLPYPYSLPEDVIAQQQSRQALKPTAVKKRLVCRTYTSNNQRIDSTRFIYNSHTRGSDHTDFSSYYSSYSISAGNQIQHIKCDTLKRWADDGGGTMDLSSTTVYKYTSNNIATQSDDYYTFGIFSAVGTFNSNGQMTRVTQLDTFGTGTLTPKREMYILYDGQGRRIMDSSVNVLTNEYNYKRTYHYDANGNLDSFLSYENISTGQWQLSYSVATTYDASNRVIASSSFGDFGMGFMGVSKDSFVYSGSIAHPVEHTSFSWDDLNSVWQPEEKIAYTLNSKQLPESYLVYGYNNQWDTLERDVYQYNAEDLLVQSNGYLYLGNGQFSTTPYDISTLYYEEHDPTSVSSALSKNEQLVIFPNPSSTLVNIPTPQKSGSISAININGQEVLRVNINSSMTTVDVNNWPAGNYFFILNNNNKTTTAVFSKQ